MVANLTLCMFAKMKLVIATVASDMKGCDSMLDIVKVGDPNHAVLFKSAQPVEQFDSTLHALLDGMREAMIKGEGVGLAAPQVGHSLRAIVLADTRWPDLINPRLLAVGQREETRQESCLSIPNRVVEVERPTEILMDAQDRNGQPVRINARGPLARTLQHEIDHLNGILITTKAQ